MKKILSVFVAALLFVTLTACASETPAQVSEEPQQSEALAQQSEAPAEKIAVRVAALKGPTGMGMCGLMDADEAGETANDYSFDLYTAPDELTAKLISGQYDIAAVPTNLAAVLNKKTEGKIQLLAVNTLGVLYIMQNAPEGETISDLSQLKGKTLYATGQGSNPEYVLNFLLHQAGLEPGVDVTIEYLAAHDELVTLAATGEVEYCLLPEPNVSVLSSKNPDMKVAIDLTEVWNSSVENGQLTMGGLVVNKAFGDSNPEAVAAFLEEYKASVDYVNSDMEAASQLIEKYEIVASAAVALKALPNCNIVCITGDEVWPAIGGYYQAMFDADPTSVGGAMPDESLVYKVG